MKNENPEGYAEAKKKAYEYGAFGEKIDVVEPPYHPTRRDYFAKAAMQGMLANSEWGCEKACASFSVTQADALIAELEKTK